MKPVELRENYLQLTKRCILPLPQCPHMRQRNQFFFETIFRSFLLYYFAIYVTGKETVGRRIPITHMASVRSVSCPRTCFCSASTWNCDGAGLTELPKGLPETLVYGNFHNNQIKSVPDTFLRDLPLLKTVDLRNNFIKELVPFAFSDLPQLETIYLSYNNISKIHTNAFRNLDSLRILRIDHNELIALSKGTFQSLLAVEEIRLSDNPDLSIVEPGSFRNNPKLERILMSTTKTNTTHLGEWEYLEATGRRTFAPNCPRLNTIHFGWMQIQALSPGNFGTDMGEKNFLTIVRRIGEFKFWSTDLDECEILTKFSVTHDVYGVTMCLSKQGAQNNDSPSKQPKSHLNTGGVGRRMKFVEEGGLDLMVEKMSASDIAIAQNMLSYT